jgi:hypothetical protein
MITETEGQRASCVHVRARYAGIGVCLGAEEILSSGSVPDRNNLVGSGPAVVAPIDLKPSEIQVLVPA